MPEYTNEEINEAKLIVEQVKINETYGIASVSEPIRMRKALVILLSALFTAESERDALKARCAELEERLQGAGWISVEERLPKSGKFVLANVDELSTPIRAFYAAPNSVEGSCEDEISIFDEEADCYWLPTGWYESNEYEEVNWFVHNKVTHWMPLPDAKRVPRAMLDDAAEIEAGLMDYNGSYTRLNDDTIASIVAKHGYKVEE